MHSLEEKNHLSNELERTKKKIEESEQSKASIEQELAALHSEILVLRYVGREHSILIVVSLRFFPISLTHNHIPSLETNAKYELHTTTGRNHQRIAESAVRRRKCSEANAPTRNSLQYSTNRSFD